MFAKFVQDHERRTKRATFSLRAILVASSLWFLDGDFTALWSGWTNPSATNHPLPSVNQWTRFVTEKKSRFARALISVAKRRSSVLPLRNGKSI
jgi:hypothetical protein